MGAGSSKVHSDEAAELRRNGWYDQPPHTITRTKSKSKSKSKAPPQLPARSKSVREKPTYLQSSGIHETVPDPRIQRSFSNLVRAHHDQIPVPHDARKRGGPAHNPLPVPPKDVFPDTPKPPPQLPRNQYSRVPSMYPSAFIPMDDNELRHMKKESKKKSKGKFPPITKGTAHKPNPSESSTSHSSASTSNPPRQVIIPPVELTGSTAVHETFLTHQRTRSGTMSTMHDPPMTPMPFAKKKKLKGHQRFFSAILSGFKSEKDKGKKPEPNPPFLPVDPNMLRRSKSVPAAALAPLPAIPPRPPKRSISPPFMLAPRMLHPPQPIAFYHPDDPHYGFTTFSPHTILYKKELYPTAEHLYQCMKFFPQKGKMGGDDSVALVLRTAHPHPKDVVLEARKLIGNAREDWKEARVIAMDDIL